MDDREVTFVIVSKVGPEHTHVGRNAHVLVATKTTWRSGGT